jgi:hypothetical protein
MSYIVILMSFTAISPSIGYGSAKACFIRRILVASNAIKTIDNETDKHNYSLSFIIYCLNCIRRDRNSTYETGINL